MLAARQPCTRELIQHQVADGKPVHQANVPDQLPHLRVTLTRRGVAERS